MTAPWLHIIGLGEDGLDGVSSDARAALERVEVVIGGERHHHLTEGLSAERIVWPSPFSTLRDEIASFRPRQTAVLVTGDPTWFSAGGHLARMFPAEELAIHPQLSAFQWAAARMGWSLADVETLTIHGRPAEQFLPFAGDGQKLLLLTRDATSPATVAGLLTERGFGPSKLSVLGALGGDRETRIDGIAETWSAESPDFHTLAVEVVASDDARPLPRWGLPDEAFVNDGKMTKRELRVLTLAALAPRRAERLWDIGLGCGSVAVEWMRADKDMEAVGVEPDADRRAMAAENARILGTPRLKIVDGSAPDALAGLPRPDAVFIGGGLSPGVAEACLAALGRHGRLVVNSVTLESEAALSELHARHGGELIRVSVARADEIGVRRGWRPAMPVTQWRLLK